jgi:Flp pilus assembly protein TadD
MSIGFAQTTALGFSLLARSQFDDALAAFRRAVLFDPAPVIGTYGAGFCELRRANWRIATLLLQRSARAVDAETMTRITAEVHIALGHCLKSMDRRADASRCFQRAAIIEPANPQIYFNHSNCFDDPGHGRFRARLARWAVTAAPGSADYWNNLGLLLAGDNSPGPSSLAYRRAVTLSPGNQHAWSNLGIHHKRVDQIRAAITCFRRACRIEPANERMLANLGRNLLLIGEFEEGWRALEEPWRARGLRPRDGSFSLPIWDGARLEGGLLLWSEEKIGEEIMFSTMLEDVARRAGRVTLLCNPRIARPLSRALPGITVRAWAAGTPLPVVPDDYSACYPLEFVGRFLRLGFSDFPPARALLASPVPRPERAAGPRSEPVRPVVGLHWRSINPLVGDYKSIPLVDWGPVLSVSGIDFVSLQYGSVREEIEEARRRHGTAPGVPDGIDQLVDMEAFNDFVAGLDLVISVSGTSAHVAGGLGRPTWVLLPRGAGLSWFWFEERDDSPWYPGCRLYRQTMVGDWRSMLERAGRDLEIWRDRIVG